MKRMTVGGLFSGIGGFELGFQRAGMKVVYSCENDSNCQAVLQARFPHIHHFSDVKELTARALIEQKIRRAFLVAGGFPCQGVSTAGKYKGLQDQRSNLFFEAARIIEETRPRWIVIENVPGLLRSNGGRDMGAVLGTLGDLGFHVAYRVLDTRGFSLPQRRFRVFIIGRRGGDGSGPREVLLEQEGSGRDLGAWLPSRPSPASSVGEGSSEGPTPLIYRKVHRAATTTDFETWTEAPDCSCTLNLMDHGDGMDPHVVLHGTKRRPRRFMPVEQERLQGFPDGWTDVLNLRGKPMAESARYKACGNAVSVPVVEWIGRRIMGYEGLA